MGKKVVLAPRNSAEAVALGVSACFLAVAGVVVQGNAAAERSSTTTANLAAQVQDIRTRSHPAPDNLDLGSRLPSLISSEPPLVLLPVKDQARAKREAIGTLREHDVILVPWVRGAGTLSVGGGTVTASRPNSAVEFPSTTTSPGIVTAAPVEPTPSAPAQTSSPSTPEESAPTDESPTTPEESAPPTEDTTPTDEPSTTPTDPGTGPGDGGGDSGGGSTGGSTGDGGTDGTDSDAGDSTDTSDAPDTSEQDAVVVLPVEPVVDPGPTPEGLQD